MSLKYIVSDVKDYDFMGESYGKEMCPNIHRYPATMIPQIGVKILRELDITKGSLLDPYCGSGSSFASGLHCGLNEFTGFDLNPLAVLISKVRFTRITPNKIETTNKTIKESIYRKIAKVIDHKIIDEKQFSNFYYWFSPEIAYKLQLIKNIVKKINDKSLQDFCMIALSSTIRDCSYTRNNEFKLYRMKEGAVLAFNPDVIGVFLQNLQNVTKTYKEHYHTLLNGVNLNLYHEDFNNKNKKYDVVLTSPPYGDSRTTVAYGQFSMFSNSWICGLQNARALDGNLMGGKRQDRNEVNGLMSKYIEEVGDIDKKRAEEVESFYMDLSASINKVAKVIKNNGYSIYVVGNRTVKGINLPTDQFIAEQFEDNGLKHIATYTRTISNKRMPKLNSPTNQPGKKMSTMNKEFIIICRKLKK
ncbi:MAG: modification methylase [Candidatus Portiera sp.]|nr:modification methylase [Portiera sp.]